MKKIFLLLFLITTGIMVKAQNSKDSADVAAAVEKLRAAMVSGNKADLESVLSKDLYYTHSNGHVQTRADFVDGITTKKSDFVKIDLVEASVGIVGQTGIARHVLVADTNDGGVPRHIFLGIVMVWKKEKSEWKLISRSAFHVPDPAAKG